MESEAGPSEAVPSVPVATEGAHSGYMLFKNEFVRKRKGWKSMREQAKEAGKAWKELAYEEKLKYIKQVKLAKGNPEKKPRTRNVPFHTRCSLKKFKSLVDFINDDVRLKARVERLGFVDLLHVGMTTLPRDLLVTFMQSYDPPTHQFRIRGKTDAIEAGDVAQLLGVPHVGEEVRGDVDEEDEAFMRLRRKYCRVPYKKILSDIMSRQNDDNFEFLFMLYTLGTFLAPTASIEVSEKLLKVMHCTMNGFSHYDWATYIIRDVWKEVGNYVKMYRNNKAGTCNVGGCLYLLMLYFGERFPLSKVVDHHATNPIKFWTEKRVQEMVAKERTSYMGLLYKPSGTKEVKEEEDKSKNIAYLDPELKDLHGKLLAVIEQNQKKLINVVEEELLKVQLRIEEKRKLQPTSTAEIVSEPGGGDEEVADVHEVHADTDVHEVHADTDVHEVHPDSDADEDDIADIDEHGQYESADHLGHKGEDDLGGQKGRVEEGGEQLEQVEKEESGEEGEKRRRSKRTIKPAIQSPWVLTKPNKRRKKPMEEKETFFTTVSRMCPSKEGDKVLVTIADEDITRDQLRTLGGIERIGNRLMSVVCKTLLLDMKKEGSIKRHIFDADFMAIMASNP